MRQFPLIPLVVLGFFLLTASGCPVGSGPQGGGGGPDGGINPLAQPQGSGGGGGMTGGEGATAAASESSSDLDQTEATPTTVPISPVAATPEFYECAGEPSFEEVIAVAANQAGQMEATLVGFIRSHWQTTLFTGEPVAMSSICPDVEVVITLPSGGTEQRMTNSQGCFFAVLQADQGSTIRLSANVREGTAISGEVSVTSTPMVATSAPCGVMRLQGGGEGEGIQELAGSKSTSSKNRSGSKPIPK